MVRDEWKLMYIDYGSLQESDTRAINETKNVKNASADQKSDNEKIKIACEII